MNTKGDTAVIFLKALCYVVIGGCTPMGSSLSQWAGQGKWPDKINWVTIAVGATIGGATQLLSFLSGSYSDYKAKGKNGGTQYFPNPTTTTTPKP